AKPAIDGSATLIVPLSDLGPKPSEGPCFVLHALSVEVARDGDPNPGFNHNEQIAAPSRRAAAEAVGMDGAILSTQCPDSATEDGVECRRPRLKFRRDTLGRDDLAAVKG